MHRFYLPPAEARKSPLTLGRSEAHHALHVLRLRQGDRATVLDGAGGEYLCLVQTAKKDCVELSLLEKKEHPKPQWQITLLEAIPKGKLIETIIQKATELGVSRVVPLLSERVVVKLDEKEAQKKAAAWQAVAIEAIKQCGAPFLTQIWAPLSITDF